jgi:hypothetical protein
VVYRRLWVERGGKIIAIIDTKMASGEVFRAFYPPARAFFHDFSFHLERRMETTALVDIRVKNGVL